MFSDNLTKITLYTLFGINIVRKTARMYVYSICIYIYVDILSLSRKCTGEFPFVSEPYEIPFDYKRKVISTIMYFV